MPLRLLDDKLFSGTFETGAHVPSLYALLLLLLLFTLKFVVDTTIDVEEFSVGFDV